MHAPTYVPGDDVSLTEDKPATPVCFQQEEKISRIPICEGQRRQGGNVISRY
jgi:hypothetical protein